MGTEMMHTKVAMAEMATPTKAMVRRLSASRSLDFTSLLASIL
jgi:hypothetical protein